MAVLTPKQAEAGLAKAARAARSANTRAIRATARAAVPLIEGQWPVLTGRSQEGWQAQISPSGADVINLVPYTSDVHEGLADQLVPEVLEGLDREWERLVSRQLLPILETGR